MATTLRKAHDSGQGCCCSHPATSGAFKATIPGIKTNVLPQDLPPVQLLCESGWNMHSVSASRQFRNLWLTLPLITCLPQRQGYYGQLQ